MKNKKYKYSHVLLLLLKGEGKAYSQSLNYDISKIEIMPHFQL